MRARSLVLAGIAVLLMAPAAAQAQVDPNKPFCFGIKLDPWKPYDGRCRYGAPLGPMHFGAIHLNRAQLTDMLRTRGLPDRFRVRLLDEIDRIAKKGGERIKRLVDRARRSWLARNALACLVGGVIAAGPYLIFKAVFEGDVDIPGTMTTFASACTVAVTAPKLNRWLKRKGFDLEA